MTRILSFYADCGQRTWDWPDPLASGEVSRRRFDNDHHLTNDADFPLRDSMRM